MPCQFMVELLFLILVFFLHWYLVIIYLPKIHKKEYLAIFWGGSFQEFLSTHTQKNDRDFHIISKS